MADEMEMQDNGQQPTVTNVTPFAKKPVEQGAAPAAPAQPAPQTAADSGIAEGSFSTGISNKPEETPKEPPTVTNVRPFQRVQGTETPAEQGNVEPPAKKGFFTGAYEQSVGGIAALAKTVKEYYAQKLKADPVKYAAALSNPAILLKDAMVDKDHPLRQVAKGLVAAHAQEIRRSDEAMQKAKDFASMGDWKNAFGAVVESTGHDLASFVPGVGPAAGQIGEDFGSGENPQYAAGEATGLIGSVLAPGMISKGVKAAIPAISEEAPGLVRPGVKTIAGEKVPISAPQVAGEPTAAGVERAPLTTRIAAAGGTEKAAGEMINKYTQPAAVKATNANLADKALDAIDDLRKVRGETPLKPTAPPIDSPADAATLMKEEAQKTYQPLDTAIETEHAAWEKAKAQWENVDNPKPEPRPKASPTTKQQTIGSKQVDAQRFKGEMQAWKDANEAWEAANPEPKAFSDLQGDIQRAQRTINSNSPTVTSDMRNQAIKDLGVAKKAMKEFTDKHGNLVQPGELEAANKLYSDAFKMSELSDKLRPIIKGTTGTQSSMVRQPLHINVERLESIPLELEKETGWGNGEFNKFMGPERIQNWNDVVNALKNPLKGGGSLEHWLPNAARILRMPVNAIMNRMLFDPEFGRSMLALYKSGAYTTKTIAAPVAQGARVGQQAGQSLQPTHRFNPATGKVEPLPAEPEQEDNQ